MKNPRCFSPLLCCLFLLSSAGLTTPEVRALSVPDAPAHIAINTKPVKTTEPPEARYSPIANPKAVVIFGNTRFTVLTPQLIRMEWAADGKFEDHASFVFLNRKLPVPEFTAKTEDAGGSRTLTLKTDALTLIYSPSSTQGEGFNEKNLKISFSLNGREVDWHPGIPDTGNLQGTTRTLDGARGEKTREPIEAGLISRDGWTVVDDSKRPLFDSDNFNFTQGEKSPWPWVTLRPAGERQDWYFFGYGHDYKKALHDYVSVAGRIPLPPEFAFGACWSRYWAYTDQELEDLVRGFHENDVPLDVFVIDMDWHKTFGRQFSVEDASHHPKGWSGYSWDRLLFPYPEPFLQHLHEQGLKTTLNLHPASGVQPWEDQYPAMAKAMGIDPETKQYVPFDITDKKFATNYFDVLHHPLEKQGIDFWWLDWQQEPDTKIPGVTPTWWLNYTHFTDQEREGKRPLLFHRWGGLGNHRYQIGFSGDTVSVWESLAFQPWFTATAANVGYAYWSHDIGGHMPGAVDPELYTRWIQFGAFSPILRTHTTKNPDSERRIWAYPEPYSGIMRNTFHLRYALEPYLYTEARRTYDTGVAFLRPLYYDWPEAEASYQNKEEYVFGEAMVVSPIVAPVDSTSQLAKKSVWIPNGEWIERASGKHFTGPVSVERSFAIDQIPVYERAGAIIPMQPEMRYTGEKPVDPLILEILPLQEQQESTYTLYQDDSKGVAYKRDICAWTKLSAKQSGDDLVVDIAPVQGSYPGMQAQRGYELRLPADWPPASVTVNGAKLQFIRKEGSTGWRFEGNTLTTVISIPHHSVHERMHIVVHRNSGSVTSRKELDGFAGATTRLRAAYDTLNALWPFTWSSDNLIDAMQTGDRLSYHPERAQEELTRFAKVYAQALTDLEGLIKTTTESDQQLENKLMQNKGADTVKERAQRYKLFLHRALMQLQDGKPE